MAKFRRPIEQLLPRFKAQLAEDLAKRKFDTFTGAADLADYDMY